MAIFRRKKDSVLPEVDQYYQAERRDRTGLAWLLALVSIAVVAGLIVSLFLAGRWAYNEITKDDEPASVAVNEDTPGPSIDGGPSNEGDEVVQPETEGEPAAQPESTPAPSTPDTDDQTPSVPVTGSASELPRTGAGSLVAVFAGVSTVAGGAHYLFQRRNLRR